MKERKVLSTRLPDRLANNVNELLLALWHAANLTQSFNP
jgi:hypothetical protein